ncbi:uncharacterized protein LOC141822633 [Curcuma longa]|uniref:uncharacterized protein LOC141822633 n=1 Tax=Curcuma longa TaxID=136217 RepID=UPI003D9DB774
MPSVLQLPITGADTDWACSAAADHQIFGLPIGIFPICRRPSENVSAGRCRPLSYRLWEKGNAGIHHPLLLPPMWEKASRLLPDSAISSPLFPPRDALFFLLRSDRASTAELRRCRRQEEATRDKRFPSWLVSLLGGVRIGQQPATPRRKRSALIGSLLVGFAVKKRRTEKDRARFPSPEEEEADRSVPQLFRLKDCWPAVSLEEEDRSLIDFGTSILYGSIFSGGSYLIYGYQISGRRLQLMPRRFCQSCHLTADLCDVW